VTQLDDSIANLKSYIAELLKAKAGVQQATSDLEDQGDELDRLEDTARTQLDAFDDELDTFEQGLADGGQDALNQVDKVAGQAQDIAGSQLDEAARDIQGAETESESVLQVCRDDLDRDAASLTESGFQLLSSTLTTLQTEVDAARTQAESDFQSFDGVVQGFQTQAETTFDQADAALDAAVAELATEGTEVAAQAAQCEQGFEDGARAVEAECGSVEDDLQREYQDQGEKIEKAGQDLIDSVDTLGEDTAGYVAVSSADQVDAPVGLVMGDSIPPLLGELGELATMLGEAEQTAAAVDPLSVDLEKSLQVVAQIDELLKSMG
jgi:chromosome segregation ATPase